MVIIHLAPDNVTHIAVRVARRDHSSASAMVTMHLLVLAWRLRKIQKSNQASPPSLEKRNSAPTATAMTPLMPTLTLGVVVARGRGVVDVVVARERDMVVARGRDVVVACDWGAFTVES